MRRIRYQVACSLDGYIADAEDGYDWIFRSLLALDLVDAVEPAIMPVVLGGGRPLLPPPAAGRSLRLTGRRVYEKSGIVLLRYDVVRP